MNKLHKKCALASAGIHALLFGILFIGPAFLAPKTSMPDMPLLDFVPFETVDALVSGGGNPNAQPPAAQPNVRPVPTAPIVQPPPQVREPEPAPPEPEPQRRRDPAPEPEKSNEAAMEPDPKARKKPQVNLKLVERKPGASETAAEKKRREREARQAEDARRRLVGAFASAANGISDAVSGSTTVELRGPGGGGIPYANFLQAVKTVYTRAWVLPDNVIDDNATVEAAVTIKRDGTVIAHKILRLSGNGAVDQSVRSTLEAVTYAAPLPRDAKEDQRTVTINFNVRAKKLLG